MSSHDAVRQTQVQCWKRDPLDAVHDVTIQGLPLLEGLVQGDLAQLAAHGGLRQLHDCVGGVLHAVAGCTGVYDLLTVQGSMTAGKLAMEEQPGDPAAP